MKKYIVLLVSLFLFFFTQDVLAIDECTTGEMRRLKEIANNVEFKTNYEFSIIDEEYKEVYLLYNIDIINFDPDLKIIYKSNYSEEKIEIKSNQTRLEGFGEKEKITFYIYSYTSNLCTDELLKKVTVDLPIYNEYYYFNKEKCNEKLDFKYCQEFMDIGGKSFSSINEEFDDYLKVNIIDNIVKSKNFISYIIIGVSIIVVIVLFLILKQKKARKEKI